ncbi:uncharacterized protein PG998_014268 [Apiospora kogelbergensis]|uniref:Uncharacterized protein n=1 Tax=Apiospora arundinis TaxID=335852 RepID=A0ABR2IY30_9PEZI
MPITEDDLKQCWVTLDKGDSQLENLTKYVLHDMVADGEKEIILECDEVVFMNENKVEVWSVKGARGTIKPPSGTRLRIFKGSCNG